MNKLPPSFFWLLLGALTLFGLRHHWIQVRHPYPVEYGEGVVLNWAGRAQTGLPLYPEVTPGADPQLHNPYPPLFPMLTAGLRQILPGENPFSAGRLLSLAGTLLSALALFFLLRHRTRPLYALLGAAVFLLSPVMMRFGSMARVDPAGLALSLFAVWLLDRAPGTKQVFTAALLASAAVMVKPTFLAAPLYVLHRVCRARKGPDAAAMFAGAALPPLIIGILLFTRESPNLIQHLWVLQRLPADPGAALTWLGAFLGIHAPVTAIGILQAARPAREDADPFRVYARLTLLAPLLTFLVSGSQENYLMEFWAAACISAFSLLHRPGQLPYVWLTVQLLLFLPVAPAPVFTRTYGQELPSGGRSAWTPTRADAETGFLLSQEIRSLDEDPAPMLSADPGHLLAAGREIIYQPYQFERLAAAGKWDPDPLHESIREHRFSLILLKGLAEDAADPTFSPETQAHIHEHYELHRVLGPWHLYRPAW